MPASGKGVEDAKTHRTNDDDDCGAGVGQRVALAFTKIGTDGPDTLRVTNKADNLLGLGGNDRIFGLAGNDNLLGGPGKDFVCGGKSCTEESGYSSGNKNLEGGSGNDQVQDSKGTDSIVGGRGKDYLFEGAEPGIVMPDNLSAGAGNDAIWVLSWSPRGKDTLSCGSGFDRVVADKKDVIAPDCERVFFGRRHLDEFFESIPDSFWEDLPRGPILRIVN